MNRKMKTLLIVAASSLLLVGCCTTLRNKWEYKITQVPSDPNEQKKGIERYWQTREQYLNILGAEGWVLVTEDQGVYYLKRRKQ